MFFCNLWQLFRRRRVLKTPIIRLYAQIQVECVCIAELRVDAAKFRSVRSAVIDARCSEGLLGAQFGRMKSLAKDEQLLKSGHRPAARPFKLRQNLDG